MLDIYLENEGYQYLKCDNALSVFEIIDKSKIVLIPLDVIMPKFDGINVCIKIREKTNAPITFISAKTDDTDIVNRLIQLMIRVKAQSLFSIFTPLKKSSIIEAKQAVIKNEKRISE